MKDPIKRFADVFELAKTAYPQDYNAMVVSTVGPGGRPSSRVVLLKGFDESGFVFFTNLQSRKGRELAANPYAALCFYWSRLEQQIRIEGRASRVAEDEADAYFATRPRGSQIGAWASQQSEKLQSREELHARVAECERKYQDAVVPRPPHWSGLRVEAERIEFWINRQDRLHERYDYERADGAWTMRMLYP